MADRAPPAGQAAALLSLIDRMQGRKALVVGDVMLDRYVQGSVDRISPEAPIPVLRVTAEREVPGGAGNTARNLAALGIATSLVGAVGDDAAAAGLRIGLDKAGVKTSLVVTLDRQTTVKTRFVAGAQQLLRTDREATQALPADIADHLVAAVTALLTDTDILVLSDYGKGVLGEPVLRRIIGAAKTLGRMIVVDPIAGDFTRYAGADLLKPNRREILAGTGIAADDDLGAEAAARRTLDITGARAIALSRAEAGMTLVENGRAPLHLPTETRDVYDVTGAGDTVVAVLAAAVAAGGSFGDAAVLANLAGSLAVQQAGATAISAVALRTALRLRITAGATDKIADFEQAAVRVGAWRADRQRIGFTNGVFDLLHPGHLALIAEAKAACDRLVVGINADASVRRLKGESRPIQTEQARALVLAALADVDLVVVFPDDTPIPLLERLRPDILMKGGDYAIGEVVGADLVRSYGGEVRLARLLPGHSTTATVAKLGA